MRLRALCSTVVLALSLLLGGPAPAAVGRSFQEFSVTIPEGWEVQESGSRILLASADKQCVVSILISDSRGMEAALIAAEMSQILKGTAPEPLDDAGASYMFTAEVGGVPTWTRVQTQGGKYLLFSVAGNKEAYAREVGDIWLSMKGRNRKVRELLKK